MLYAQIFIVSVIAKITRTTFTYIVVGFLMQRFAFVNV